LSNPANDAVLAVVNAILTQSLIEESSWQIGLEHIMRQFASGLLVRAEIQMKDFETVTSVA